MLTPVTTPDWLAALTADTIANGPLPLQRLLNQSLYYPASGDDAHAIELLSNYVPSFVHVDYSRTEADITAQLTGNPGFAGYKPVGLRRVTREELTPQGWSPSPLPTGTATRPLPTSASPANSFALWAVYERQASHGPQHGAARFSLLHLHAEGVAAYDALYRGQGIRAQFIAIVQPGEGFGDNWTRFTQPGSALHNVVDQHPAGLPEYLVQGGGGPAAFYTERAHWPEYSRLLETKQFYRDQQLATLAVWGRAAHVQ